MIRGRRAWSKQFHCGSVLVLTGTTDKQKLVLFAPLCAANSNQQFVCVSDSDLLSCSLCRVSVNQHAKGGGSSASILIESLEFPIETQKGI